LAASSLALAEPASAKDGKNGAFVAGAAAGVVGGALLGNALSGATAAPEPEPGPVYVQQPPAPVYVQRRAQTYVEPEPAYAARPATSYEDDPRYRRLVHLRQACDDGDTRSCIRFGFILGQNRERERQWRRSTDLYSWDN
jgi:hypothetical protein